jgi:hypothetical protein
MIHRFVDGPLEGTEHKNQTHAPPTMWVTYDRHNMAEYKRGENLPDMSWEYHFTGRTDAASH